MPHLGFFLTALYHTGSKRLRDEVTLVLSDLCLFGSRALLEQEGHSEITFAFADPCVCSALLTALTTQASLLFLKNDKNTPVSGPLHLM